MDKTHRIVTYCLAGGLLVLSSAALFILRSTRPVPEIRAGTAYIPRVETLTLEPVVFDAPIVGYGTVRPKRQVKIVPEVGGRLTQVHKDLAVGNYISKGDLLFEIDPRVYESKMSQVQAEINRLEAQLRRHQQEQASLEKRLQVAERMEILAKTGVDRESGLVQQQSGTAPEVERAEERYLGQHDAVLTYRSQLDLIPLQIEETNALLDTKRAQLEEARFNVEKTRIYCPFDARVDGVTAQETQVVIASFQIATLTDMEALEVSVVIDPRDLRWTDQEAFASAIGRDLATAPEARVTWTLHGQEFTWSARVTRLERLDEVTRTAHVVVEMRDIMRSLELGHGSSRLPLSVGMFCRAELPTEPLPDALLVPRHALRDGDQVYVFVPDPADARYGKLTLKHVPILRHVGESVLVSFRQTASQEPAATGGTSMDAPACNLRPGDQIVLSALPKAVEGMRLERRLESEAVTLHHGGSGVMAFQVPHSAFRIPSS